MCVLQVAGSIVVFYALPWLPFTFCCVLCVCVSFIFCLPHFAHKNVLLRLFYVAGVLCRCWYGNMVDVVVVVVAGMALVPNCHLVRLLSLICKLRLAVATTHQHTHTPCIHTHATYVDLLLIYFSTRIFRFY